MIENEFVHNGNAYVAKDETDSCEGCALYGMNCLAYEIPSCDGFNRQDGRNVIFVEKQS